MGVLGPRYPLMGAIFTVQARWVKAKTSNFWVMSLRSPSHWDTRYPFVVATASSRQDRHDQPILIKDAEMCHCIGSTLSQQTTGMAARALFSGHKPGVSCTFGTTTENSGQSRASKTRQLFPIPCNCPNVCSGVMARRPSCGRQAPCSHWKS